MGTYIGDEVTVFYVDGENGDDSNDDTEAQTFSTAWQTIDHAFDRITSTDAGSPGEGDAIHICETSVNDGRHYSETTTATIDMTLSTNQKVFISGANTSGVVDGTQVMISGGDLTSSENAIWECTVQTADNITFANLYFDGKDNAYCHHCMEYTTNYSHHQKFINCRFSQAANDGFEMNGNPSYISYINCQFDNNGGIGLANDASSYALTYRCLFNDNASHGAYFSGSARIVQCAFYDNGDDNLNVSLGGCVVCGCVFEDSSASGCKFRGNGTGVITDCVSTGNAGYGWEVDSNGEAHFFNCHSHGNSSGPALIGATDRVLMYPLNVLSDPSWESESTHDFTPDGSSLLVGGGLPTPYLYMGSTTADAGLGKFRTSPYQISAGRPRRH